MAAGDYITHGTGTLPASGPGEVSTVVVTATSAAATSVVLVTPTATARDANGPFTFKVTNVTTNAFTVTADRAQLPSAITFQFIVFAGA